MNTGAVIGVVGSFIGVVGSFVVLLLNIIRVQLRNVQEGLAKCASVTAMEEINGKIERTADELVTLERRMEEKLEKTLLRIEDKIDQNEERSSNTRHEIRDNVHTLALKVEELRALTQGRKRP